MVINCTACQKPLTGGTDTFGDMQLPMCQECWFDLGYEPLEAKTIGVLELGRDSGVLPKAAQYEKVKQ